MYIPINLVFPRQSNKAAFGANGSGPLSVFPRRRARVRLQRRETIKRSSKLHFAVLRNIIHDKYLLL